MGRDKQAEEARARRQTLTIEEAARVLGIGRNSAYEAARRGEIPTIKVGRRLVVPRAALDRILAGDNRHVLG
jgi:excisionase family DNA binding protein